MKLVCKVPDCPAGGQPQEPERAERPDAEAQAVLFGTQHRPAADLLIGHWLPCGHYVSLR